MKIPRIIITAGPTQEFIDPVRVITNLSTGTFGYALAEEAVKRGFKVILISGPVNLTPPEKAVFVPVTTAAEMLKAVRKETDNADCLIMAAAVSDFRVKKAGKNKIKKRNSLTLELTGNTDILASVKDKELFRVGFALESEKFLENAKKKLIEKNLDVIVMNKAGKGRFPFGDGRKEFTIIEKNGKMTRLDGKTKKEASAVILDIVKNKML